MSIKHLPCSSQQHLACSRLWDKKQNIQEHFLFLALAFPQNDPEPGTHRALQHLAGIISVSEKQTTAVTATRTETVRYKGYD